RGAARWRKSRSGWARRRGRSRWRSSPATRTCSSSPRPRRWSTCRRTPGAASRCPRTPSTRWTTPSPCAPGSASFDSAEVLVALLHLPDVAGLAGRPAGRGRLEALLQLALLRARVWLGGALGLARGLLGHGRLAGTHSF